MLDNLLDHAVATTPDSLRSMGSTAVVTTRMLSRFAGVIQPIIPTAGTGEQPFIADYFQSLFSFTAGFRSSAAGYRMPFLARPPLLAYGFYGAGGPDFATTTLQSLTVLRSQIAELIDCLCCDCTEGSAAAAAISGKLLFDLDRAIDLFCLGTEPQANGSSELHAAAYSYVIESALRVVRIGSKTWATTPPLPAPLPFLDTVYPELGGPLRKIQTELRERNSLKVFDTRANPSWGPDVKVRDNRGTEVTLQRVGARGALVRVLEAQVEDEVRWRELALSWSPICDRDEILGEKFEMGPIGVILADAQNLVPALY
jgi:hypothetical protein